jgi:hypothetical protein
MSKLRQRVAFKRAAEQKEQEVRHSEKKMTPHKKKSKKKLNKNDY